MSVVSDRNTTLLKRPSRIYRAALSTITCLELGDRVAAQLATEVVLALVVIELAYLMKLANNTASIVSITLLFLRWRFGSSSGIDSPQSGKPCRGKQKGPRSRMRKTTRQYGESSGRTRVS